MAENNCENCAWRAKYDARPKSFLGRLWKWHINFCPGWKMYLKSLNEEKRKEMYDRYGFRKI